MKEQIKYFLIFILPLLVIIFIRCTSTESGEQNLPGITGEFLGQTAPGATPQQFAPEYFSSFGELHSTAVFSPDGRELFWTPMDGIPWEIMNSKIENGVWTNPGYASFNSEFGSGDPSFTPDGNRIFFLSWASSSGNSAGDKENIWYVDSDGENWGNPHMLGDEVNHLIVHWMVSASGDGTLYFSGAVAEGEDRNIYFSEYINGQYTQAQLMSEMINTSQGEDTPFIAPDESYLIFGRGGGPSSTADLFISYRNEDSSWTQSINMGNTINTESHELYPIVSGNGEYLFFMSMRNGLSKPYWIDAGIIESLRQ